MTNSHYVTSSAEIKIRCRKNNPSMIFHCSHVPNILQSSTQVVTQTNTYTHYVFNFAPCPRYYQLFAKILRAHVTLNTSPLGIIYHACTSSPQYCSFLIAVIVVVRVHARLLLIASFDRVHMSSFSFPYELCPYLAPFLRHTKILVKNCPF